MPLVYTENMEQNYARSRRKPVKDPFLKKYFRYIFCLIIALIAYLSIYLLLKNVYPSQIQNVLFANSYLPFFTLLFIANFFLLTFLSHNSRLGLLGAFLINFLFYLKINQIKFDFLSLSFVLLSTLFLAGLLFFDKFKKTMAF
jgi:hypothetical protein